MTPAEPGRASSPMTYKKKLIEVALPLEDINRDLPAPRLRQAGAVGHQR